MLRVPFAAAHFLEVLQPHWKQEAHSSLKVDFVAAKFASSSFADAKLLQQTCVAAAAFVHFAATLSYLQL